jgi:hypothetical protein
MPGFPGVEAWVVSFDTTSEQLDLKKVAMKGNTGCNRMLVNMADDFASVVDVFVWKAGSETEIDCLNA